MTIQRARFVCCGLCPSFIAAKSSFVSFSVVPAYQQYLAILLNIVFLRAF